MIALVSFLQMMPILAIGIQIRNGFLDHKTTLNYTNISAFSFEDM